MSGAVAPDIRRARDGRDLARARLSLFNPAWLAVGSALALSLLGIIVIGTASPAEAKSQVAHLCVGLVAATMAAVPPYRLLRRLWIPLSLIVLVLLVFVLIPAIPESIVRPRNGARRWIRLGIEFQPSELAKAVYVVAIASYLQFRRSFRTFLGLLIPLALSFIPMGLILIEPDLGTAMLFLPTLFAMLAAAGAKLRHLVLIVTIGLASAPLLYPVLQDHQKDRILALISQLKGDSRYDQGIGYQGRKAITLVGAGGVTGVGLEQAGHLLEYNHLPEEHNDMVFAVVALRWGLGGACVLFLVFGTMCIAGLIVAAMTNDPFGRLIAVGIVAVLFAQMTINTGMTIGLLPITGMNLPFVSCGGSSLVAAWIMIGVLVNVGLRRPQFLSRESNEFDAYLES